MRTHCYCGKKLPSPFTPHTGDWGEWRCSCGLGYCQECGAQLDLNDECTEWLLSEEIDTNEDY